MPKLASLIVDIRSNTAKFQQGMDKAERKLNRFQKSSKALGGSLLALGGAAGMGYLISRGLELADTFNVLQSRIQNATRDTGDYIEVTRKLNDVAKLTGSNLSDTVDVFQRLTQSRQDLGATNNELIELTALVQKLGVVSGASGQAMSAGLLQFGQGLSAGIFRAEEFNSILENMPALANSMAKGLGKSPGELRKMVLAGDLFSKDVMAAILGQAEDINAQFGEMPLTMERAGTSLSNSFSRFLSTLDQAADGTGNIAKVMQAITESLDNWSDRIGETELDELMRRRAAAMAAYQQHINSGATATSDLILGLTMAIDELDAKIIAANRTIGADETAGEPPTTASGISEAGIAAKEEELAKEQEHKDKLTQLENDHWAEIDRIRRKNMTQLQKFNEMNWKGQTQTVLGAMVDMTQGVAQSSKTMFNINKVAATAQAIIAGYEGVAKTLGAYPYPINIGMAALSAAASAAQVSGILGTTFGGGGSAPSLSGVGGGATTVNTVDVTGVSTDTVQTSTLTVNLGDFDVAALPETTLRTLLTQIEDARSDMGDATQVIYV